MTHNAPSIRLESVSLAYGDGLLVENLSVEFNAASFTCLLGPSGIGKSTLLRYIAGLAGPVIRNGRVSASDGHSLFGRVGWLPQEPLLLPWLNVLDNVCLGARLRGELSAPIRQRALEILARIGLSDAKSKFPAELSGGMQRRTALARTLIEDYPIVLMDEPFAAVDAITRRRLQLLAIELLKERTVLLVTHDPYEALRVGDRIHVLNGQPAVLTDALAPTGTPPRDASAAAFSAMHARLLAQLDGHGDT